MHKTMFDTFLIKDILRLISLIFLKITGWKVKGSIPRENKFVMIAAPHTSNWDLPYLLAMTFALKANIYWMGKEQIFKPPFKRLMMWMGGIPVNRSQSNNLVEQSANILKDNDKLIITVPPEGTRSKVKYWKTGFYYIAVSAEVPIILSYLNYATKTGGIGPTINPTGNIEDDMVHIKAFYAKMKGKNPSLYE